MWDPDAAADTTSEALKHRHKVSPYVDRPLKGRVRATFVQGRLVFSNMDVPGVGGVGVSLQPCGRAILKHAL